MSDDDIRKQIERLMDEAAELAEGAADGILPKAAADLCDRVAHGLRTRTMSVDEALKIMGEARKLAVAWKGDA